MQFQLQELIPIVAELAGKATGYESSSVSYEKAEQLMGVVLYTIRETKQESRKKPNQRGKREGLHRRMTAKEAYDSGYEMLCRKVRCCQEAYNRMILSFDSYGNEFYEDTVIKGLPQFFLHYDVRFCPQDTILTLDYPTRDFRQALTGIDQIEDYLRSISEEQQYLQQFPRQQVLDVLRRWHPDYRELPVNLAEIMGQAENQAKNKADESNRG